MVFRSLIQSIISLCQRLFRKSPKEKRVSDYGIKVAKPGFDVDTAGDADLIFNSAWASLPVAAEATITNKAYGGDTDFAPQTGKAMLNHNLGFAPFSLVWVLQPDDDFGGRLTWIWLLGALIDKQRAYIFTASDYRAVHIKCYNINLEKDIEYPFVRPPTTPSRYDPDYGIKIAKEGKSVDSTDLRDFALHSRAQSPQILAVKTEASAVENPDGTKAVIYKSPQNYTAWAFGFVKDIDGEYTPTPYYSQGYPRFLISQSTDGTQEYNQTFAMGAPFNHIGATVVVLKDPMFAPNSQVVRY